jgi:hypothetical protein
MGLVTGNTFSVTLTNPTGEAEGIKLFRQGYTNSTPITVRTRYAAFAEPIFRDFYDVVTGLTISDIQIQVLVGFVPIVSMPTILPSGSTLAQAQALLNSGWLITRPENAEVQLYVDSTPEFIVKGVEIAWSGIGDIATVAYIVGGVPTSASEAIPAATEQIETITVGSPIEFANNDYSYAELLATQTGSPMNVIAMDVDVLDGQPTQITNPLTYKQFDMNGDEMQKVALGLVDPYQFQTRHLVNIPTEGLLLDGSCELDYTVNAYTTVKLTFRYVNAAESMLFGMAIRQQIADQYRQAYEDMINLSNGLKKTLIL